MADHDPSRDTSDRPAPMSTPDCNLRGLEWMPLDVVTLPDSDLFLKSSGDGFKAAVGLWCKAWRQIPAGSLPNDEESLAQLSGLPKKWKRVRDEALHGWVLCSDGRLYHQVIARKAMEVLPSRQDFLDKKSAEAERKARERQDRKELFALLKRHGIVAHYTTTTTELRKLAAPHLPSGNPPPAPPAPAATAPDLSRPPVTPERDAPVTGVSRDKSWLGEGEEITGEGQVLQNPSGSGGAPASPSPPPAPPAPTPAPPPEKPKRASTVGEQPPQDEPLSGPEQRSTRPWRRCPRGFVVTEAMVLWANQEYPILEVDELRKETRAFRNHRFKTGRIEWVPTWENWIKEAADRKTSRARPAGGQFTTSREHQVAKHLPGIAAAPLSGPPPRPAATLRSDEVIDDAEPRAPRLANH